MLRLIFLVIFIFNYNLSFAENNNVINGPDNADSNVVMRKNDVKYYSLDSNYNNFMFIKSTLVEVDGYESSLCKLLYFDNVKLQWNELFADNIFNNYAISIEKIGNKNILFIHIDGGGNKGYGTILIYGINKFGIKSLFKNEFKSYSKIIGNKLLIKTEGDLFDIYEYANESMTLVDSKTTYNFSPKNKYKSIDYWTEKDFVKTSVKSIKIKNGEVVYLNRKIVNNDRNEVKIMFYGDALDCNEDLVCKAVKTGKFFVGLESNFNSENSTKLPIIVE